jgi:hypothetical protein
MSIRTRDPRLTRRGTPSRPLLSHPMRCLRMRAGNCRISSDRPTLISTRVFVPLLHPLRDWFAETGAGDRRLRLVARAVAGPGGAGASKRSSAAAPLTSVCPPPNCAVRTIRPCATTPGDSQASLRRQRDPER